MNSTNSTTATPPTLPPDLGHDDTGPRIIVACFVTWSIAFVFVVLRFWTRGVVVRKLGPADWCIGVSLIAAGGMCVAMVEETKHGMGRHWWDINFEADGKHLAEAWWFSILTYNLTLALTKVSICLLYLTIFTFEWVRKASWALLVVVVISNIWTMIAVFTNTIPLKATWDLSVKATFTQSQANWWVTTGFAIGTDLIMVLLPIPAILPLKLPRRQKIVVVGIFVIGFFECIVSFIRLGILIQAKVKPLDDVWYTGTELTYWTIIEVHTAIVVACLMTLKPLASMIAPCLFHGRSECTKDESSAAPSDPPLTIGSRPLRNIVGQPRPDSWIEAQPDARDVMLDDIEAKAGQESPVGTTESTTTVDKEATVIEMEVRPPNTALSQRSERTFDLQPTIKPRSIG